MSGKKVLKVLFVITSIISFVLSTEAMMNNPQPVNKNATKEARALLKLIYDIRGKYILSGHHNMLHNPVKYTNQVKEMTGEFPVVWGCDFSFNFRGKDPKTIRTSMIKTAIEMHKKGHIITLMWHSCFPSDGDDCTAKDIWIWQPGVPDETWDSLITEGTKLNQQWQIQIDRVAEHLEVLQKAGVPVLWRPYHEMNGIWFWWCNKKGENGFSKLWRMMFDRFVTHHQLNNLLWVWNANAPRSTPGDEAYAYEHYFPGLDYVDILAADVYHFDYKQSHHDEVLKLARGKPVALGEVGKMPTPEILAEQPQWTWFMGWADWLHKANRPDSVRILYDAPSVITLSEITYKKEGGYQLNPK